MDGGGFIQAPPLVSKVPILLPKYPMGQRQLRHSCSEISDSPAPRAPPVVLLVLRTPKRQVVRLLDQSRRAGTGKVDLTSSSPVISQMQHVRPKPTQQASGRASSDILGLSPKRHLLQGHLKVRVPLAKEPAPSLAHPGSTPSSFQPKIPGPGPQCPASVDVI